MNDLEFWQSELTDDDWRALKQRAEDLFSGAGRIKKKVLDERTWTIVMIRDFAWGPMCRLREAYPGEQLDLYHVNNVQMENPEYSAVRQGWKNHLSATSAGDFMGALIVDRADTFALVRYESPCAATIWIFASDQKFVETVAGASLSTRWLQLRAYADYGEGDDGLRRDLNDLCDWYQEFNGGIEEPALEKAQRVFEMEPEPSKVPDPISRIQREWSAASPSEQIAELPEDWIACPIEGTPTWRDRRIFGWADTAERLAEAAGELDVDRAYGMPLESEGSRPNEAAVFEMSRDDLLRFDEERAETNDLLIPSDQRFLVYGSSYGYHLFMGPKDFVLGAMGCKSMDLNLSEFEFWRSSSRRPDDALDEFERVADACETRWLEYLEAHGEEPE